MSEKFPGYDVLTKRIGMSWNPATRRVIDDRLAVPREARFFNVAEWQALERLCSRILPQPLDRPHIPLAAYIDDKMLKFGDIGTRIEPMPWDGEAWKRALQALDVEAAFAYGKAFAKLSDDDADELLQQMQKGDLKCEVWGNTPPDLFFKKRILTDIPAAYYAHPSAWSEIGFGGPASPRGYVRMDANRRDPWEAAEANTEGHKAAYKKNRNVR